MKYICDAPDGKTWFRLETEIDAEQESSLMDHCVVERFRRERARAIQNCRRQSTMSVGQDVGLERQVRVKMPIFLTLRDRAGAALVTAVLAHGTYEEPGAAFLIVGKGNSDPYPDHSAAIEASTGRAASRSLEVALTGSPCPSTPVTGDETRKDCCRYVISITAKRATSGELMKWRTGFCICQR